VLGLQKRELNDGIANFYDESSGLWESMWGEHMHHGYYEKGAADVDNQQAQIDMVDRTLAWAGVEAVSKVWNI
jgi:tocopherol O-methyltransferase